MPRRRISSWLPSAALAGLGVVEAAVFFAQQRPLPALLAAGGLGLIAWVLSPAPFPRAARRPAAQGHPAPRGTVVVYWRPGCAYCLRLRWALGRLARRATWVDIWSDDGAAAFVRGVNDGNETVPTVVVAESVHTNPDVAWVRRALQQR